jgi:gliding motility-associated-like protein
MKNIKLFYLIIALSFFSWSTQAQSVGCNCWQPLDTSYHIVPIRHGSTGAPWYRSDDGYTNLITIPFSFCFYGSSVNQIYVNMNGFITWGHGHNTVNGEYDAVPFPTTDADIIAPFWADVDTKPAQGLVWYKQTLTYFIIRWDSVGYYDNGHGSSSGDDNFEVIVSDGTDPIIPNGNNIEFCYGNMQWAVGTASGGTNGFGSTTSSSFDYPAVVGINDYSGGSIQYGLFNTGTSNYFGSSPAWPYDGVYWLDNKQFIMNGCTGNSPPTISGLSGCGVDTMYICEGDTLKVPLDFYSVVNGVTVNSALTPPVISGTSIIYNVSTGQNDTLVVQFIGNSSNIGYNTIGVYGYDNLSPADTNFATFVVKVSPSPAVTISAVSDTICLGNSSVLTAGGGISYLWSTGATAASFTVTPTVTTTYSVAIATASCTKDTEVTVVVEPPVVITIAPANTGICAGSSISLTASGATTYSWLPATGLSCYTCASPNASPTITTIYTITGSANGCSSTLTDTVKVYPLPLITTSPSSDSICVGTAVNLLASGGTTYTWVPSTGLSCTNCSNPVAAPELNTIYDVTGTDANGCSNTATVSIFVSPLPALSVSPDLSICPGRSITINAYGNGSSYTCNPGNSICPYLTVSPTSTEIYTVTMTSGCGDTSASVTVTVNPQPVPLFYADVTTGCAPLCIQFHNTSTIASGSIAAYEWNFGSGDTANSKNPIYCFQHAGVYSIILTTTSDSGCSSTLNMNNMITVYSVPNASFTLSPQPTTMLQPTIQFTNTTTDAYGVAGLTWNFGDATDSTSYSPDPSHTYQDTGYYCAKLFVTNIHGCTDSATNCLVVSPDYCLYIPDAFSPNGDGINDLFAAKGHDVKSFEMYIFDRWGTQVFHSNSINEGWNGEVNNSGNLCQEDAYVYMITVFDTKNQKHTYTGSVNLIK